MLTAACNIYKAMFQFLKCNLFTKTARHGCKFLITHYSWPVAFKRAMWAFIRFTAART